MKLVFPFSLIVVALLIFVQPIMASDPTSEIQVIKISSGDGAAVVRLDGGDLQVVKAGDRLEGLGAVGEVGESTLVLEVLTQKGRETWMITVDEDGQSITKAYHYGPDKLPQMVPGKSIVIPLNDTKNVPVQEQTGNQE